MLTRIPSPGIGLIIIFLLYKQKEHEAASKI